MSAAQLSVDTLDLSVAVPLTNPGQPQLVWPWYSDVEAIYGNVCGTISIKITYEDGTPTNLVQFVPGPPGKIPDNLSFSPLLSTPVGEYWFKMTATMTDYGYQKTHVFKAVVTPCAPILDASVARSMLSPAPIPLVWGSMLQANLGVILTGYVQQPSCGYSLVATPLISYSTQADQSIYDTLDTSYEISATDALFFQVQKCNTAVTQSDPECTQAPYTYRMNVKFFVQVFDSFGNLFDTDDSVNFIVEVTNPCGNDQLAFASPIQSWTYQV